MNSIWIVAACSVSLAAQPNLSGVWEATQPEHILTKINQQGASFEFATRLSGIEQSYRVVVGADTLGTIQGIPITTTTEWDGNALVIRIHGSAQGRELTVTGRYVVSNDGNRLELVETHKLGDAPEEKQTRVYQRQPVEKWVKIPPPEAAEAVYKNIQFLKSQPAEEVPHFMGRITRALGLDCGYCHVPGKPELDDKLAKRTARKMMLMVRAIDSGNFPETNAVTCWM